MCKIKSMFWITFVILLGCSTGYNSVSDYQGVAVSGEVQYTADSTTPSNWRPANISEAISACRRVEKSTQIPVNCGVEYLGDTPAMLIGFPDSTTFARYATAFTEVVAAPFCSSAVRSNRQALLLYTVRSENVGSIYSCESGELSDWFDLDELARKTSRPDNMAEVVDMCRQVQGERNLPIGCAFNYYRGQPAVFISFSNSTTMKQYINEVADYIAIPFCDAANNANRRGVLVFWSQRENIANMYNCETNRFLGWVSMDE